MNFSVSNNEKQEWLVFIHGIGAGSEIWQSQIQAFKAEYNILAIDLYSHGESIELLSDVKTDRYLPHISDRIEEYIHDKGIEDYHLVGFSFGTTVIKHLMVSERSNPKSVIMCGAVEKLNPIIRAGYWLVRGLSHILPYRWLAKVALFVVLPFFNQHNIRGLFFSHGWQKREFRAWMELYKEHRELLKWNHKFFARQVPKLYISGSRDYLFFPGVRKAIAGKENVQLQVLASCGHAVMAEKVRECRDAMSQFLDGGVFVKGSRQ